MQIERGAECGTKQADCSIELACEQIDSKSSSPQSHLESEPCVVYENAKARGTNLLRSSIDSGGKAFDVVVARDVTLYE